MGVWLGAADGTRAGVSAEGAKAATRGRQMTLDEAQKILGVNKEASLDEVLKVSLHRLLGLHSL